MRMFTEPKNSRKVRRIVCMYLFRKRLFAGTVPANKNLFAGTVPANKNLFAGTSSGKEELICRNLSGRLTLYFDPRNGFFVQKNDRL